MAALLRRPAVLLLMVALVLIGMAGSAFAGGRDVVLDAEDGRIDGCYTRAEFRDALEQARDDQRLYANSIDVIKEGEYSNVAVPGQPCGHRTVPRTAAAVSSSGASGLWAGALALVAAGAITAGALAGRRAR